jgi:1-acyl-sn-glycerol-3-phosphate acyltransferase
VNLAAYKFGRSTFRGICALYGGLEWVHEERVPKTGPLIVAPNHVSFADPHAVGSATTRVLRFMAKKELFAPVLRNILLAWGAFPVDRGGTDLSAIRLTLDLLGQGEAVLVFPEGTRGDGKTLQMPNQGVAMLAKRSGAPVIPVGVVGTAKFLPRGAKMLHRSKMSIIWGEPFTYAEVAGGLTDKEARDRFACELMTRIRDLIGERGPAPAMPREFTTPRERPTVAPNGC